MSTVPNILIVSIESMDGRALSCLGFPGAKTPELDRLAEQGVLFANTYCPSALCVPSRAATWSGRDCHRIGAWNNFHGLPNIEPHMASLLAQHGYHTGDLGRRDMRSGAHSLSGRISDWTRASGVRLPIVSPHQRNDIPGDIGYPWDWNNLCGSNPWNATHNLVQWLADATTRRQPFFLHYGIGAVHTGGGYNAAQKYRDQIKPDDVRVPPWEEILHPALQFQANRKNRTARLTDDEVRASRRNYLAAILEVNDMIAFIRANLAQYDLADNTILIVHGDHGDMQLEHGHQWGKNNAYEASTRVPLIIHGPGITRGRRVDGPVSLVDLLATVLDLAEAPAAPVTEGYSLAPYLAGKAGTHPHAILCQNNDGFLPTGMYLWRRDQWKYVAYAGLPPQLFDVVADPDELHDLAAQRPEMVAELDAELRERIDYPVVDAAVKEYDRAEFRSWWFSQPSLVRETALAKCYGNYAPFTPTHREQLLSWAGVG